jgi:PAS domain S-box-containing protein
MNREPAVGLTNWSPEADAFLASILKCVAQPVWVVDHDGLIVFANPAAVAALGFDDLSELRNRPSHETIHYKRPDGSVFPVEDCPMLRPRLTGETVHSEQDWFVRRDGSMFQVAYRSAPIETPGGRGAVVAFTDIEEAHRADQALRERDAILGSIGQPVYVVDDNGVITYANLAAIKTLGYDDASELVGHNGHRLLHSKRPDGSPFPIEECPLTHCRQSGEAFAEEDWLVRKDGSLIPIAYTSVPIQTSSGYGAAVAFTDIGERRIAERTARERDVAEARAAELAASEARQRAILDAALDGVISLDDRGRVTYFNAAAERTFGYRSGEIVGRELADVIVPPSLRESHRRAFGRYLETGESTVLDRRIEISAMGADGREFPVELTVTRVSLPGPPCFTGFVRDITERHRAEQALVEARSRFEDLAGEQASLRRVATLVARGADAIDVFDAVCEETGRLIAATIVNLTHFTSDGMVLTMSGWSLHGNHVPTGTRLPLQGDTIDMMVRRTHRAARVDSYDNVTGEIAVLLRRLGIRSEVAAPVVVDGQVWGALIASLDQPEPFPEGTEARVASFAELIATAVSNATARSELIESRARTVAAADAARQRVTRDLHDGAQQHLVNSVINLQLAHQQWASAPGQAKDLLDLGLQEANLGIESLRELAAGIHPAILTYRGLAAALDALAVRLPMVIQVDACDLRLPAPIEASIYFFCSEALTNVVKHARASTAHVIVAIEEDQLVVEVRDDGVGGTSRRSSGSGLSGLHDRIGALNGTLDLSSPTGGGTTLRASIPLPSE